MFNPPVFGFTIPSPLAGSDFQHNKHYIGRTSKNLFDLWGDDPIHDEAFSDPLVSPLIGPFAAGAIVPGVGFTLSSAAMNNYLAAATDELNNALPMKTGITALLHYTLAEGAYENTPRVRLEVTEPEYAAGAFFYHDGDHHLDFFAMTDPVWDTVNPSEVGTFKAAITFSPEVMAYSLNGDPAHYPADTTFNLDAVTPKLYLNIGIGHGVALPISTATVHSAHFFPAIRELSALEALARV